MHAETCLVVMAEEADDEKKQNWFRKYWILRLSQQQLDAEIYWHDQFCKYVGDHFDCRVDGSRIKIGAQHAESEWKNFYGPYKEYHPDFNNNQVIGWFQM